MGVLLSKKGLIQECLAGGRRRAREHRSLMGHFHDGLPGARVQEAIDDISDPTAEKSFIYRR
jgi:hypothetical protein